MDIVKPHCDDVFSHKICAFASVRAQGAKRKAEGGGAKRKAEGGGEGAVHTTANDGGGGGGGAEMCDICTGSLVRVQVHVCMYMYLHTCTCTCTFAHCY